jgi:uncharacterized membrane-anchored protein YitT (DUF2179 family)
LVSALTEIPIYYLIPLINLPFIIMGHKTVGINFAVKTALAIGGLALVLANVDFPNVTNDNILVAVFGGFFLGAGIGLSIRGGAVIDGTEVLALYLSKKLGTTIGDVIIIINVMIFSAAATFIHLEIALNEESRLVITCQNDGAKPNDIENILSSKGGMLFLTVLINGNGGNIQYLEKDGILTATAVLGRKNEDITF